MKKLNLLLILVLIIACTKENIDIPESVSENEKTSETPVNINVQLGNLNDHLKGKWNAVNHTVSGVFDPEWPNDGNDFFPPYNILFFYEQGFELKDNHIWYPRYNEPGTVKFNTDSSQHWGYWYLEDLNTIKFYAVSFLDQTISDSTIMNIISLKSDSLILFNEIWGTSYLIKDTIQSADDLIGKFNSLKGVVLGYNYRGQEDKWCHQNNLLNVYADAITFKSDSHIDIGFIGYGYGHDDLSFYSVVYENKYTYCLEDTTLFIYSNGIQTRQWNIVSYTDTTITFHQPFNDETFFFDIEGKIE